METNRPLFLLALIFVACAVLIELGATALAGTTVASKIDAPQPGWGVPCLAFIDGLVLLSMILMGSAIINQELTARFTGAVTLVASLVTVILAIILVIVALVLLGVMVILFLAVPFGTIAYGIVWGSFDRAGAGTALTLVMLLKIAACFCLLFAHPRYLSNKSFVLLVLTSLVGTIVVSFLHGFVPRFVASITDIVAAIVVMILGALWALYYFVFSIKGVWRALSRRNQAA